MRRLGVVLFLICVCSGVACAWWPRGHSILTRASVAALPSDAPAFLKAGVGMIAHASVDPDVAKNRGTLHLEKAGHPAHFFNVELFEGRTLPASRYEFGRLCAELGKKPEQIGLLPYVTAEHTEQLALALAEYRKWPENPFIQNKCLVYAGMVAHFAQEVCQPLNLTIHWNGRVVDGKSSNTRIHEKIDGLLQNLELKPDAIADGLVAAPLDSLMGGIVAQITIGHNKVDQALEMEKYLVPKDVDWKNEAAVRKFAEAQAKEAARFTAAVYLTAWKMSEKIRLPGWVDRGEMDHFGAQKK
jgi:hypothetical protein